MDERVESAPDAQGAVARRKVLVLGPRRAGKSSVIKVVYESLAPNDTLFLASTTKPRKVQVDPFQSLEIWDMPGSALQQWGTAAGPRGAQKDKALLGPPWQDVSAVIFVVDAQDEYYETLLKLHQLILAAYAGNARIQIHVFINKVDGLSDDYKYDIQRDIEQRVYNELIDVSHGFSSSASGSAQSVQLDEAVDLHFHLTSVFDASVFVALSRIQQKLLDASEESRASASAKLASDGHRPVSLHEAVETACNALCSSCSLEKAYVFDLPSRTFVTCDSSPFDFALFDIMYEYIRFTGAFSDLYANIRAVYPPPTSQDAASGRKWSQSVARLGSDTTLGFWQLDKCAI